MNVADAKRVVGAQSRWVGWAGRVGYVAKGSLYAIIALLAIQIPLGLGGRTTDAKGALATVAAQPLGNFLLVMLALGLAGFAAWRLAQVFLGRSEEGGSRPGLVKRIGYLAHAVMFATGAFIALTIAVGGGSASGGNEKQQAATVFDLPLGRYIVGAVGLGFLGAGIFNGYRSLTTNFRKLLRERELGKGAREWMIALGVAGHAARAVVFSLVGVFLVRAAVQYDAKEAIGLDGALWKLAHQSFGPLLLGVVAAGLLAFALFCFIQARYGDV